MKGARVQIPVTQLEFIDGGNTLWIHGPGTVFRIKTMNGVFAKDKCEAPTPHGDICAPLGDITICIPPKKRKV